MMMIVSVLKGNCAVYDPKPADKDTAEFRASPL